MKLIQKESCCFTGHRQIPARERAGLSRRLREEIYRLAEAGTTTFLAGGALGFDTMAAREVLFLRESALPNLHLVLVLPCLGQESLWAARDVEEYRRLMKQADEVIYTGDLYSPAAMFVRDRYLVDHSSSCLCYLRPGAVRGGTLYTVNYAQKRGLRITNLAENPGEDGFSEADPDFYPD